MELTRRQFLATTLGTLAVLSLEGKLLGYAIQNTEGQYVVDLSSFPSLSNQWGSVRLTDTHNKITPSTNGSNNYYVVLTRVKSGTASDSFASVHSQCKHLNCSVDSDFNSSQMEFICHCHDSRYKADGTLISGPATTGLKKYTNTYDSAANTVAISIPEWTNSVADGKPEHTNLLAVSNYPNPFGTTTNIVFELATPGTVAIDIYSTDGKLVAHVMKNHRDAGKHIVPFDAQELTSGIYHYRISVGDDQSIGEMQVIK